MSCGVGRRCSSDPSLLWLRCRCSSDPSTASALIWPLAWELPYAIGWALKHPPPKKKVNLKKIWIWKLKNTHLYCWDSSFSPLFICNILNIKIYIYQMVTPDIFLYCGHFFHVIILETPLFYGVHNIPQSAFCLKCSKSFLCITFW